LATVGAKSSSSGNGYFPGELSGIAVSVKDGKRFANEPGSWNHARAISIDLLHSPLHGYPVVLGCPPRC
jgi:hypothetical protein